MQIECGFVNYHYAIIIIIIIEPHFVCTSSAIYRFVFVCCSYFILAVSAYTPREFVFRMTSTKYSKRFVCVDCHFFVLFCGNTIRDCTTNKTRLMCFVQRNGEASHLALHFAKVVVVVGDIRSSFVHVHSRKPNKHVAAYAMYANDPRMSKLKFPRVASAW